MRCYYAHCQAIYNTPQERRDVEFLQTLGFEVVNPNTDEHQIAVIRIRKDCLFPADASKVVMGYFERLVKTCGVVAFRALPDGRIPAGIVTEIGCGVPCFELPSGIVRRSIGVEETREFLAEIGQR
jgi:hypothetical protein